MKKEIVIKNDILKGEYLMYLKGDGMMLECWCVSGDEINEKLEGLLKKIKDE